jgi:hypothetical protein
MKPSTRRHLFLGSDLRGRNMSKAPLPVDFETARRDHELHTVVLIQIMDAVGNQSLQESQ